MKTFLKLIVVCVIIFIISFIYIKNNDEVMLSNTNISSNLEENSPVNEGNKTIYKKALVIGNSITLEKAGIGMAASDEYHDYYYLVKSKLQENYKKIDMDRISAVKWEENREIPSRTEWIEENLSKKMVSDLDLVIFQLGENCKPDDNLEGSITELVEHVRKYSPNARMLWVSMWFINDQTLSMLPELCEKLNIEFIDISDLVVEENRSYVGAVVTTIDGDKMGISTIEEAFHPNDTGMKLIADRIINKLEL